jgi:hypothetical protein
MNRFYYVASPAGTIKHRFYSTTFVEGTPTQCGIRVQKGWFWWTTRAGRGSGYKLCKRCDRAG